MNKQKEKATPSAVMLDAKRYYRSFENKKNIGFSLSYGVRNHSSNTIQVRTKAGYSQLIVPSLATACLVVDQELERPGVWLDIRFKTVDIKSCERFGLKRSNTVDRAIDEFIKKYVIITLREIEDGTICVNEAIEINFSIYLPSITPNFGSTGYYSETLGLIIDTETNNTYREFLAEVHQEFGELHKGENSNFFEIKDSVYQFAYLIDNTNDVGEVWCLQNGQPTKISGRVNHNLNSGLYIFTQQERTAKVPYRFYPIDELNETLLASIGFALSKKEAVESTSTKEHVELMRRENTLASENEKLREEIRKLKKELEDEKFNTTLVQRKYAEERLNVASEKRNVAEEKRNVIEEKRKGEEAIRTATDKLTTEIKHLKEDLREEKLNVKNEQRKVADEKRNVVEERRKAEEEKRIAVEQLTTKVRHLEEDLRDEKRKTADEKRKRENDKEKVNKNKTADILATVNSIGGLLKLAVGLFKCIPKFA